MKTSPEELFWHLAAELQRSDPRIEEGTIMNGRCLRVGKEFLALVDESLPGLAGPRFDIRFQASEEVFPALGHRLRGCALETRVLEQYHRRW